MYVVLFYLMILLPPRSTRTDTLCPYTTLFRSKPSIAPASGTKTACGDRKYLASLSNDRSLRTAVRLDVPHCRAGHPVGFVAPVRRCEYGELGLRVGWRGLCRSEVGRVGEGCVSECRSRWSP